jgi:hypothetical protein
VQALDLACQKESNVDLTFEGVDVDVVRPTAASAASWQLRYVGVGTSNYRKIDLVITTMAGLEHRMPPGDSRRSGTRSATGIVSIQRGSDVVLKFKFVETGTDTPVTLGRVVFSLFDLDLDSREVTVSGISEYFVSRRHSLRIENLGEGSYRFSGIGSASHLLNASVLRIWQDSLRGMVSLKFRRTAEFTIRFKTPNEAGKPTCHTAIKGEACYTDVLQEMAKNMRLHPEDDRDHAFRDVQSQLNMMHEGSPCHPPCVDQTSDDVTLEFAGWSELVNIGKKVVCGSASYGPLRTLLDVFGGR